MKHPFRRWRHIRTTNIIERGFKEVKRRVKVMETFRTFESYIRILYSLLSYKMRFRRVSPLQVSKFTHVRGQYQYVFFKTALL